MGVKIKKTRVKFSAAAICTGTGASEKVNWVAFIFPSPTNIIVSEEVNSLFFLLRQLRLVVDESISVQWICPKKKKQQWKYIENVRRYHKQSASGAAAVESADDWAPAQRPSEDDFGKQNSLLKCLTRANSMLAREREKGFSSQAQGLLTRTHKSCQCENVKTIMFV